MNPFIKISLFVFIIGGAFSMSMDEDVEVILKEENVESNEENRFVKALSVLKMKFENIKTKLDKEKSKLSKSAKITIILVLLAVMFYAIPILIGGNFFLSILSILCGILGIGFSIKTLINNKKKKMEGKGSNADQLTGCMGLVITVLPALLLLYIILTWDQ